MKRWMKYGVIFVLGGLSALGYNTSWISKSSLPSSARQSAISAGVATSSGVAGPGVEIAVVGRVIDGDTIELTDKRKVRYIGVDTPESVDPRRTVQCFGKEAKEENARLVDGKTVRLERDISDTDKYGRLLRYVYVGEVFVNDYLVRQGAARIDTVPPDVAHREQFLEAEREARREGRGLWGSCR
ncbi:MAG: thermonuclease family protein [Candidatus Gottesmanbacteria bacterium]|nr:thermonuclease family protein [Candidatus Gottesmanbacteria bacterium]